MRAFQRKLVTGQHYAANSVPTDALAILIALFVALVLVAFVLKLVRRRPQLELSPYSAKSNLLSPAERSFLGVLVNAIGTDYVVAPKVRVADAVAPRTGMSRSDWQRAFNRISAKHFDYVVCRASDFRIVAAVELDDKSHKQARRRERDQFLEAAIRSADLPLLRFDAKSGYSQAQIRDSFAGVFARIQSIP
jgi:hypothetical protein